MNARVFYKPETFPGDQPDHEPAIAQRERELWGELEMISEALQDPKCLEVRGPRVHRDSRTDMVTYTTPAVRTGAEALRLLRSGTDADLLAFARIVRAEVAAILRERAEDEIAEEADQ